MSSRIDNLYLLHYATKTFKLFAANDSRSFNFFQIVNATRQYVFLKKTLALLAKSPANKQFKNLLITVGGQAK